MSKLYALQESVTGQKFQQKEEKKQPPSFYRQKKQESVANAAARASRPKTLPTVTRVNKVDLQDERAAQNRARASYRQPAYGEPVRETVRPSSAWLWRAHGGCKLGTLRASA